jgi:hypothetical protein
MVHTRAEPALVAVPPELAAELTAECDAIPIPNLRGSLLDAALVIGNATSVVALVLTAKNVARLRRAVVELAANTTNLEVRGRLGNREVALGINGDTAGDTISEFIANAETPVEIEPHLLVPGVTAFISYAWDNAEHVDLVRRFWRFLRLNGIDARIDLWAAREPRDWAEWTLEQIKLSTFVLMIASPEYKIRAEGRAQPGCGRGVRWEAQFLRDLRYQDDVQARRRHLPVVLPGRSVDELPDWVLPASNTHYIVRDLTPDGARELLTYLTNPVSTRR